jgi:hypothetical protein
MRPLFSFFLFCMVLSLKAETIPQVRFSFTDGSLADDQNALHVKAYNVSFVKDRFGNLRSACYLQGGDGSYLNLGTSNSLKPIAGTISMWLSIAHPMIHGTGVEANPILFTRAHNGEDHNEAFYIGYDYLTENLNVNTTLSKEKQITIYSEKPAKLREWYHVVLTYDENYLSFYVNGILQAKLPKKFKSEFLQGDSVLIGSRNSEKNKRFYNGAVDDIAFFGKVLNEEEVLNLFHAPDPNRNHMFVRWAWIGFGSLLLVFLIIWLVRKRVKQLVRRQTERNLMELHSLEQEIKTLKAQMDPHFIFNSMNTILQFIITKQNDKAEIYLTKFSKLVRMLLESNTNEGISLADEMDILKKYLEIEALRFDQTIITVLEIEDGINAFDTHIPHMMIQPFVENAIWHGLRLKEGQRKLTVKFEKKDEKSLFCSIEDNGIGRNNENNPIEKENRSLAINFIKQRLELMSRRYDGNYSLNVIDKTDEKNTSLGTLVEITLPIIPR